MSEKEFNSSTADGKTYVKCLQCGSYYEINSLHRCYSGTGERSFSVSF